MKIVKQLFDEFKPVNYKILVSPDIENSSFKGMVTIRGELRGKPRKRITLHQKGLKIFSAQVTKVEKDKSSDVEIVRINNQNSFDEVRIHLNTKIYPGSYLITLEYSGRITETMHGLYPSYFDKDGKKQVMLSTQLESHHAREVFPCIDEPAAKATFDLSITSALDKEVLSNTPIKKIAKSKNSKTTVFETTPIMSTYLLAFVISDLECLTTKSKNNIEIRTWTTPGKVEHTKFALDVASKTLDYFEDYFDIPFPLKKCDFVAIPDFAAGAMENWGLITFRESTLLVDEKSSALDTRQYVALVVAHELAHQWFGNLVTMKWWTDLWLNEGFASWVEYLAVNKLFPEWNIWEQFTSLEYLGAMSLDSLEHTHPVEVPVPHPSEIRSIFDAISYNKGASVIRMLETYLGAEEFKIGLQSYLKKHAYSNASTSDLWIALEESSGRPVIKMMSAWTKNTGFPIVRINQAKAKTILEQERYFINPESKSKRTSSELWPVPLLIDGEQYLFNESRSVLEHRLDPMTVNPNRSGFYILDSGSIDKFSFEYIKSLNPQQRLGLVFDLFQLAKAGFQPTIPALELMAKYTHEENLSVWHAISSQISAINNTFDNDNFRDKFREYVDELTITQVKRLGWSASAKESHSDKLLRPIILSRSIFAKNKNSVDEAKTRFASAKKLRDIDPDLQTPILGAAVREGDEALYDKLTRWYEGAESNEDRDTLSSAITGFKQKHLTDKSLERLRSSLRLQDVPTWLVGLLTNRHAKLFAWEWVKNNWAWLEEKYGNETMMSRFPVIIGRALSTRPHLEEYDEFFATVSTQGLERSIAQGREVIIWRIAWRERDENKLMDWLADKYKD